MIYFRWFSNGVPKTVFSGRQQKTTTTTKKPSGGRTTTPSFTTPPPPTTPVSNAFVRYPSMKIDIYGKAINLHNLLVY